MKTVRLCLRVSERDMAYLKDMGARYEMSVSEYVRYMIWQDERKNRSERLV